MITILAGAGALEAMSWPHEGRVLASFPKACYLLFPKGLAALVGPQANAGPIHVILDSPPPMPSPGSTVHLSDGWLFVEDHAVPLAGAPVWRGELPSSEVFRKAASLISEAADRLAGRSLLPSAAGLREECLIRLAAGDLEGAADLLGGLGPGFTPAGDDALLGLLFALRAAAGEEVEHRLLAIAAGISTTIVSRSMLAWGARGQALAPVHDLVCAAAEGDRTAATAAAETLAGVGHSSGADTALGLSWGAQAVRNERFLIPTVSRQ